MRIGVMGDTHNNLRSVEKIIEIFERKGVEQVVHTGDITQPQVLEALARLSAPVCGVWGNNDQGERARLDEASARLGMSFGDGPLELEWSGRKIVVVHDPRQLETALAPHHALALHGHTHLYRLERIGETVVFSPGECAGMLEGHNRVGWVELDTLACEIEHF